MRLDPYEYDFLGYIHLSFQRLSCGLSGKNREF